MVQRSEEAKRPARYWRAPTATSMATCSSATTTPTHSPPCRVTRCGGVVPPLPSNPCSCRLQHMSEHVTPAAEQLRRSVRKEPENLLREAQTPFAMDISAR